MTKKTIKKLNQLNQNFYRTVHESFDQTRSSAWQGWEKLVPFITKIANRQQSVSVLDVGCGNGRFLSFLHSFLDSENLFFTGVDNSLELLKKAQKLHPKANFSYSDIVDSLLEDFISENTQLKGKKFDLITLFGVMHHIPSQNLRAQLISDHSKLLNKESLLIIANWQFADDPRYKNRYVMPSEVGIDTKELGQNDFILDWQKGVTAYRYCHHTTEKEMKEIIASTELTIVDTFFADGKSGKLNHYFVLSQ